MADPVSLASGVLALTTFAVQATKTLYQAFDSFQNNQRAVRENKEELEDLQAVLENLQKTIQVTGLDLSTLKQPLLRCGEVCERYTEIIKDCSAHSNGSRTSVRDWIKYNYRGKDITTLRNLIASYKSTITIALADSNMRSVGVTQQLLKEYKVLIKNTQGDLEELLTESDAEISQSETSSSTIGEADMQHVHEERASIEHCLKICMQVSNHINEIQIRNLGEEPHDRKESSTTATVKAQSQSKYITNGRMNECKRGIGFTVADLQLQLRDINKKLRQLPGVGPEHGDEQIEPREIREHVDSIKECLSICENATAQLASERINVFEDVKTADDGQQIIVSTIGDLISAKHISVGARSAQWLGQMSDDSLQGLTQAWHSGVGEKPAEQAVGAQFANRHGSGRSLNEIKGRTSPPKQT